MEVFIRAILIALAVSFISYVARSQSKKTSMPILFDYQKFIFGLAVSAPCSLLG